MDPLNTISCGNPNKVCGPKTLLRVGMHQKLHGVFVLFQESLHEPSGLGSLLMVLYGAACLYEQQSTLWIVGLYERWTRALCTNCIHSYGPTNLPFTGSTSCWLTKHRDRSSYGSALLGTQGCLQELSDGFCQCCILGDLACLIAGAFWG